MPRVKYCDDVEHRKLFEVSTVRAKLFAKTVDNYKADLEQFKLFFGKLKADYLGKMLMETLFEIG